MRFTFQNLLHRNKNILLAALILLSLPIGALANAQNNSQQGFSLQVTPSPLVATIKPGQASTLELKILNTSSNSLWRGSCRIF